MRSQLDAILNPPGGPVIKDYDAQHLLSYLEGVEALDEDRHAEAVLGLAPLAMVRWVSLRLYASSGKTNQALGNALFLLGEEYLRFAQWELSCEFFSYAGFAGSNREFRRRSFVLSLITAFNSSNDEVAELILQQFSDHVEKDVSLGRVVSIATMRVSDQVPEDETWLDPVLKYGPLATALLAERLSDNLILAHRFEEAKFFIAKAIDELGELPAPWLRAALLQNIARADEGIGDTSSALDVATRAWALTESLRYGDCEHRLREAAWERYVVSRTIALRAAIMLREATEVAQLMERDRFHGSVEATLEVEADDVGASSERLDGAGVSGAEVEPSAAHEENGPTAPKAIFTALEDVYATGTLLPPALENRADLDTAHIEWWLGIARYGREIYWSVLKRGNPIGCGIIDLSGHLFLGRVIDDLTSDSSPTLLKMGGAAGDGQDGIDPHYHLSEWGTAEERMSTSAMADLIPPPIVEALNGASPELPIELVISVGNGLSGIPWPIISLPSHVDGQRYRLIERATIRHWASAVVEHRKRSRRLASGNCTDFLPLLVAIDNPRGDLAGTNLFLHANASAYFDSQADLMLQTGDVKAQIVQAFHNLCHGHPPGVFFYRGHAESESDPAHARLQLPIAKGAPLEDHYLPSGEFFGEFEQDHEWIPLPSRVVLSCCSSSSTSLFGGETIGLAAACILGGGATEVIATSTDVYDCSFTSAFDDHLAEAMTLPVPHEVALRQLQIEMYQRWREFSLRGGISVDGDITFPHPLVWAMYQAI